MGDECDRKEAARARKAAANKGAYAAERQAKDRVLLRLDRGAAKRLDEARASSGLSRSAFVMLHVEALRRAPAEREEPPAVGDEFDSLFGVED